MNPFFEPKHVLKAMSGIRHSRRSHAETQIPHAGEHVRVKDRIQTGVVLCVHHETHTVDVLLMGGLRKVVNGIPLESITLIRDKAELSEAESA